MFKYVVTMILSLVLTIVFATLMGCETSYTATAEWDEDEETDAGYPTDLLPDMGVDEGEGVENSLPPVEITFVGGDIWEDGTEYLDIEIVTPVTTEEITFCWSSTGNVVLFLPMEDKIIASGNCIPMHGYHTYQVQLRLNCHESADVEFTAFTYEGYEYPVLNGELSLN